MIDPTTRCSAPTSQHDCRNVGTYHLFIGGAWNREAVLCAGCLAVYLSMGMDFRAERRRTERVRRAA